MKHPGTFSGILLLDFEAINFHHVVYRLVEEFGIHDDLEPETKTEILRKLLLPHKYVDGHTSVAKPFDERKRNFSRDSLRGSMKAIAEVIQ